MKSPELGRARVRVRVSVRWVELKLVLRRRPNPRGPWGSSGLSSINQNGNRTSTLSLLHELLHVPIVPETAAIDIEIDDKEKHRSDNSIEKVAM